MHIRTPNFITTEEIVMDFGPQDKRVIPAGSSVRPVEWQYLNSETQEKWKEVPHGKVFVYCRYGFWPVRKDSIREY